MSKKHVVVQGATLKCQLNEDSDNESIQLQELIVSKLQNTEK